MNEKVKVYLGALTIFVFGAVSGGFGSALVAQGSPFGGRGCHEGRFHGDRGKMIVEKLTKKLDLSAEQRSQVEQIVEKAKPEMEKLREENYKNKDNFRQKVGDEIKLVLNADQQKKFEEIRAKMKERIAEHREERKKGGYSKGWRDRREHDE